MIMCLMYDACSVTVQFCCTVNCLSVLGRRGLYTGSSGLTVAYLSGIETSVGGGHEAATDNAHYSAVDVDDLRQSLTGVGQFRGVDLLVTSQWPRNVDKYATAVVSHHAILGL